MVMSIRLDRATEAKLERLARRNKTSKSQIVRAAIRQYPESDETAPGQPKSLYDALKPMIGIVRLKRRDRSKSTGELFREYLLKKKREGRL